MSPVCRHYTSVLVTKSASRDKICTGKRLNEQLLCGYTQRLMLAHPNKPNLNRIDCVVNKNNSGNGGLHTYVNILNVIYKRFSPISTRWAISYPHHCHHASVVGLPLLHASEEWNSGSFTIKAFKRSGIDELVIGIWVSFQTRQMNSPKTRSNSYIRRQMRRGMIIRSHHKWFDRHF